MHDVVGGGAIGGAADGLSTDPPALVPPPRVLVVLGMHRSGTSLCANMLQAMGVDMADRAGASPNNPRGHWERARINDLNDQVLTSFGRGWAEGAHALALPEGWLADARAQVVREALVAWFRPRLGNIVPLGFKDPRTVRLMPLWHAVFATLGAVPRYVFCVRDPAQVARSVAARDHMAREQAEYRWLVYNAEAVAGVQAAPVCVVPYEDWFAIPDRTASRLASFAGVAPPNQAQVARVVDPALRHDDGDLAPARPLARRLHRQILRAAAEGRFDADLAAFCGCVREFQLQVQPLLVEVEVLRASVTEQNRVIADLNALVRQLRGADTKRPAAAAAVGN